MILRAPGKMLWLGEYVVLEGAPAVVASVDRYAEARVEPWDGPGARFESDLFGVWDVPAGGFGDEPIPVGAELAAAVVREVVAACGSLPSLRVAIDTSELASHAKLGIGSSSAVAAVLTVALCPGASTEQIEGVAMRAHWAFQGGRGSGVDVLAALHGGVLLVEGGRVERIRPPEGLGWAAIATGTPASTTSLLERMARWRETAPLRSSAYFRELRMAAEFGASALRAGDTHAWLHAVELFVEREQAIDRDAGIGIFAGGVSEAIAVARRAGWTAKPSGAGGGDVVVAFADQNADCYALTAGIAEAGMTLLNIGLAPAGALQEAG